MEEKYIATVMERIYVKDDTYLFICRHAVVGNFNEESNIFTDIYGNEYYHMRTSNAITLDVPYAVYNVKKIEELKKKEEYKDQTLEYIISEYCDEVEQKSYVVGYTDDFTMYYEAINYDAIKRNANRIKNGETVSAHSNPNVAKLEKIILDVAAGEYSIPEMEAIKSQLEDVEDVIENTIGTIDNKIGAINENKTLKDYINEQIEVEKKVAKPPVIPEIKKNEITSGTQELAIKVAEEKKKEKEIQEHPATIEKVTKKERVSIKKVLQEVKKTIIAQDEPIRRLLTELVMMELEPSKKKYALMITGATGTGKTKTMEKLAEKLGKKLYIADTLQLSKAGYTGKDIEQVLYDLYEYCGKDINVTENSIIYLDEIDKKGSSKKDDVSGQAVLNILLKLIEGSVYDATRDTKTASNMVRIDTKNITVVVGGAFSDVLENLRTNTMGFNRDNNLTNEAVELDKEAFIKHGMMPREFMGRMKIIKFNDLTQEDIKRILEESDESVLRIQQKVFDKIGVKLKFTDSYATKVAEKAYKMKTGARGLEDIVSATTWQAFAEVSEPEDIGLYSSVTLTEETVEDNTQYKLVKRRQKNKK